MTTMSPGLSVGTGTARHKPERDAIDRAVDDAGRLDPIDAQCRGETAWRIAVRKADLIP